MLNIIEINEALKNAFKNYSNEMKNKSSASSSFPEKNDFEDQLLYKLSEKCSDLKIGICTSFNTACHL
jgi:hypothetical protein